mgnify:CR=1 FL=1
MLYGRQKIDKVVDRGAGADTQDYTGLDELERSPCGSAFFLCGIHKTRLVYTEMRSKM